MLRIILLVIAFIILVISILLLIITLIAMHTYLMVSKFGYKPTKDEWKQTD